MKVLQIILPQGLGGVESIANILDRYFKDHSIESYVAIGASYYDKFIEKFSSNSNSKYYLKIDDRNSLNALRDINKIIRVIEPDIIQTHARRECFFVCLTQNNRIHIRTQHMAETPSKRVTKIEKQLLHKRVSKWIATSKSLKNSYLDKLDYIDSSKISVIYNGIADKYKGLTDIKKNCKSLSFCVVSRLTKQKGIDILLEEFCKFPKDLQQMVHIDIWGEGIELVSIENFIVSHNLGNIFSYRGNTNEPTSIFGQYSALLMPSRYEGLPLTMLEAMSCRLPVAIHDVGCCKEFIRTNINGWIINDSFSWLDFFNTMIQMSEETYQTVSENARKTFCSNFTSDNMCSNYLRVYNDCIKELGGSEGSV